MGRIAKVISLISKTIGSVTFRQIKLDTGGDEINSCEHFAPCGDDSPPLDVDYAITTKIARSGGRAVVGYVDSINAPSSNFLMSLLFKRLYKH